MGSKTALIFLFIFVVIEYYSYTAINTITRSMPNAGRAVVLALYILLSLIVLFLVFNIRRIDSWNWSPTFKTIIIALVLGVVLAKLLMGSVMLIDDLRRLLTYTFHLFTKQNKTVHASAIAEVTHGISRSKFLATSAVIIGGLMLGGVLWGTRNKYNYAIKRVKLKLPNLPSSFKGLKIVQISDIHSGSFDDKEAVTLGVEKVMKENADMILFTGDLVNNEATEIVPYKEVFSKLKAPMGVYSVLGNHDYGDYKEWSSAEEKRANLEQLKHHQKDMGWQLLMNEHRVFERNGEKIALLGIENWGAKGHFPKYGKMKEAYAGLADQDIAVKILMSHDPSHWDAEVRLDYKDIDLTLSGHTHGMQLGLRLPWLQWSPVQYMYKQWAGMYKEGKQRLYVNVGYGFLGYRGRLGIMPEITVFELV